MATADQVYGDAQWLKENPALIAKFSQLLTQYGIVPDQATMQKYGLGNLFDPNSAQGAQNNPYSVAALLKNQLSGALTGNATSANARGALFSGAFQNMQDQSGRNYQQSYAKAGQDELAGLFGIQGQQNDLYNTIFGRLLANPVAPDSTATPAPPAATPPGKTVIPQGNPQGPYGYYGPGGGGQAWNPPTPKKKMSNVVVGPQNVGLRGI